MAGIGFLVLADGTVYEGEAFGAPGRALGEVVFNTSMTGYQEILTDPSYAEQLICMTYPHIGNYGTTPEDDESSRPWARGFLAREFCRSPSNHRSTMNLESYLRKHGVVGLHGFDTRALTRRLRDRGAVDGIIGTDGTSVEDLKEELAGYPGLTGLDLGSRVSCTEPYTLDCTQDLDKPWRIAVMDFGVKRNIVRELARYGDVTVFPAGTAAETILAARPDGVLLSNGPGDPEPIAAYAAEQVRALLGVVPVMGICMGFQVLALTLGARTYKLKFGHRGGNHPVSDLATGRVEITSHNHGFAVSADSLPKGVEPTHLSLSDGCLEGFRCTELPAFAVQYHPEAAPGPHDAAHLFGRFDGLMRSYWDGRRG